MLAAPAAALAISAGRWRIDYVSTVSGREAIYSADASGRSPLAIVSPDDPTSDFADPLPSPDGRRIVFSGGQGELVSRADGSGAVVLTRSSVWAAAWSPDSTQIAWLASSGRPGGGGELHMARADGTGDHVVRNVVASGGLWQLVWSHHGRSVRVRIVTTRGVVSPDGRWIAAYTWAAFGFAVRRTGTGKSVAHAAGRSLTWSPDSRRLAYATASGISVLDVRTGRTRLLTPDDGSQLRWSPDGTMLAYVDCCTNSALGIGDIRTVTLTGSVRTVVKGADAGSVSNLEWARAAPGLAYRPAAAASSLAGVFTTAPVTRLAADGNGVVYVACGGLYLWTPADGSLVTGPTGTYCDPYSSSYVYAIALAGRQVAYGRMCCNNVKSWTLSLDVFGQPPLQLLAGPPLGEGCCTSYPVLAGHGSLIAYADRTGFPAYTWTVRVPGGQPLISFEQNRFVPVALDVDGDRILVARDGAVDVVLSENGGTVFHLDVPANPALPPYQHKPPDAQLDGPFVAVRNADNVEVYAVNGGTLLHTWPLPEGATLQDAAHGLLAVSANGEIYVLRLTDGLRAPVAAGTLAAFMDDGLAIANGARLSVTPYSLLPSFAVRTTAVSRPSTP